MSDYPFMRYAIVTTMSASDNVAAYLPGNYEVLHQEDARACDPDAHEHWQTVVIGGRDDAGWTLHGYVIPRLQSALLFAKEIGLDHPVMKRVPDRKAVVA